MPSRHHAEDPSATPPGAALKGLAIAILLSSPIWAVIAACCGLL